MKNKVLLGGGGFGQVYLVKNIKNDIEYAIKIFSTTVSEAEIVKEMKNLSIIDH